MEPRRLRVIGSREIFRFFLPSDGKLFDYAEFSLAIPGREKLLVSEVQSGKDFTVIINPEEFDVDRIIALPGTVFFWFLHPLVWDDSRMLQSVPLVREHTEALFARRTSFLERVMCNAPYSVVCGDELSFEYCSLRGYEVSLSPPPVSDSILALPVSTQMRVALWPGDAQNHISERFLSAVAEEGLTWEEPTSSSFRDSFPSHVVVPPTTITSDFPYEAALALMAGRTLVSGPLEARWGLEPGIDFLEYSTPAELRRIVEHLRRYPYSTQLMTWRGRLKGQNFRADQVYYRLLSKDFESRNSASGWGDRFS